MIYFIIPYVPNWPIKRAILRKLKEEGLNYKIWYLGELMDENYVDAEKWLNFPYAPRDLKKLDQVKENPQVVDLAFEVLYSTLQQKNIEIPNQYQDRAPYYPNTTCIVIFILVNAIIMTLAITLFVLYIKNITLMISLIVVVSVLGAFFALRTLQKCVIYIHPDTKEESVVVANKHN